MPITRTITVDLPTYDEIRANLRATFEQHGWPSRLGLALLTHFQQEGARDVTNGLNYVERRNALLSARAKWSLLREHYADSVLCTDCGHRLDDHDDTIGTACLVPDCSCIGLAIAGSRVVPNADI